MITRRNANKPHVCNYGCGKWIKSGSVYLRHAVPEAGSVVSLNECGQCATGHGRAGLLEKK